MQLVIGSLHDESTVCCVFKSYANQRSESLAYAKVIRIFSHTIQTQSGSQTEVFFEGDWYKEFERCPRNPLTGSVRIIKSDDWEHCRVDVVRNIYADTLQFWPSDPFDDEQKGYKAKGVFDVITQRNVKFRVE